MPAAELKVKVAIEGIPQTNERLRQFEGSLKRVSGQDATATLQANVEGRGFDEYESYISRARMETARPITQTVKADVDQNSFASAYAEVAALKAKIDSAHGGGLTSHIGGVVAPFGKLPTLAALASPQVLALAGATGALAASLSEAALGAGALAVGGGGMATVGIAGIIGVAVPAVGALKELTKAQGAYIEAVETYGVQSSEAESAGRKLLAVEKQAGKESVEVVRGLSNVKERWEELSKPGREAFLGALSDGLDHLERKLPILSKSANRSTKEMRRDFNLFLDEVTGKGSGFNHFLSEMTDLFEHEGPMVTHILADWAKVGEHLAIAAGPSLEEVTEDFSEFSDNVLQSTENAPKLRREVGGLVDQTLSWVHLLGQAGDLVFTLFGAGAGEGQDLVDSMTRKLEGWKRGIEADPQGVEDFFENSVETTKELGDIVSLLAEQWFVVAEAMGPVDETIHDIAVGLNSIKIGNVSALTVLLGAFTGLAIGKKVLELGKLATAYGGIQKFLRGEAALTEILAGSQASAAAAANAEAAANARLAASLQGVTAARSELLIANASGTVVGTASTVAGDAAAAGGTAARAGATGAGAGALATLTSLPVIGTAAVAGIGIEKIASHTGHELGNKIAGLAGEALGKEIGPKINEALAGHDIGKLEHLRRWVHRVIAESVEAGADDSSLGGLRKISKTIDEAITKGNAPRQAFHALMGDLHTDAVLGMDTIQSDLHRGLAVLNRGWDEASPAWRTRAAGAMEAAVGAIRTGMREGRIDAEKGKKEINKLLGEIHLVKSDDPFGLAKATAGQFKQANEISSRGVHSWLAKLDVLKDGTREKTVDATMAMLRAWAQGNPKIEAQIDGLTAAQVRKFGATNKQLREGVQKGATGPIADAFRQMAAGNSEALENLGINVNAMLKALGLDDEVQFQALVLGPARSPQLKGAESKQAHNHPTFKQDGGIIPGVTSGDSVERMVRPNTFILNREATRSFGFQDGGHVPVILEPGEREFTPEEVNRIGLGTLMWMNEAVPRFAKGGEITGKVSGPGVLAKMGHAALGLAFDAGQHYVDQHKPKPRAGALGSMQASGSVGDHPELQPGISAVAATILKRWPGLVITSTTGGGHAEGSYHYMGRAVDIGGSAEEMLRAAAWIRANLGAGLAEGIHNPNLSIDSGQAVPPSFWGASTWAGHVDHIHVAKQRGGLVGFQDGGRVPLITGSAALDVPTVIHPDSSSGSSGSSKSKSKSEKTGNPGYTSDINHLWAEHEAPDYGGPKLPPYVIAALAEAAGAPGVTMEQVTRGESSGRPGSSGTDAAPTNGHTTKGWGLWAITSGVGNDSLVAPYGGYEQMLNPVKNAAVMAKMYASSGLTPWHGDQFVTGDGQHYTGHYDIRNALGGHSFKEALTGNALGEAIGGSGAMEKPPEPKQVKGKYVKHKKGTTDKSGGTYAETTHGTYKVATDHLSFGSLPDSIEACTKELEHRRTQLREYRAALRDAKDNRVRHDLEVNIGALEDRIAKLRKQRIKLVRERQQKKREERAKKKVAGIESAAEFSAWTDPHSGIFAREEAAFDLAEERAAQSVSLEPEEPRIPASASANQTRDILGQWINGVLAPYVSGTESARYGDVLGVEGRWRNSILGAESYAGEKMEDWRGRIGNLQDRIAETRERIEKQRARVKDMQDRIEEIQGYKQTNPTAWEKHRDEIPDLRKKIEGLQGDISRERGEIPGFQQIMGALRAAITKTRTETLPEWEQSLGGIQGLGRSHEVIGSLPSEPSDQFGGSIFQTQMTIHELGLKVPNAIASLPEPETPEGPDRTEQLELELQLSKQANQRLAVANVLGPTLAQFEHTYPIEVAPWMGAYAEGGVALVGERGPEIAHFPSGTRIHNAADTQQMLAAAPRSLVIQRLIVHPDRVEIESEDQAIEAKVLEVIRSSASDPGVSTPGGHSFLS